MKHVTISLNMYEPIFISLSFQLIAIYSESDAMYSKILILAHRINFFLRYAF